MGHDDLTAVMSYTIHHQLLACLIVERQRSIISSHLSQNNRQSS